MFRVVVAILAVIGLVSLFANGSALGVGALLLAPFFFIAKVVFFFMLFGFIARGLGAKHRLGGYGHPAFGAWSRPDIRWMPSGRKNRTEQEESGPSEEERFEEWHRMTHARREVDSWVEDIE